MGFVLFVFAVLRTECRPHCCNLTEGIDARLTQKFSSGHARLRSHKDPQRLTGARLARRVWLLRNRHEARHEATSIQTAPIQAMIYIEPLTYPSRSC